MVQATAQALQGRPVRVIEAYRAAMPCWGRLMAVYLFYGLLMCAISLVFAALTWWYKPALWRGPEDLARYLATELRVAYYIALINFCPQVLVLEGYSLRQAWSRCRQLPADALGRLAGVLVLCVPLGVLGIEVLLPKADRWAEVLGSGLTNLLCMVGITGVYWEERGRGVEEEEEDKEEWGPERRDPDDRLTRECILQRKGWNTWNLTCEAVE
ncbi:MAG: hypothetical protein HYW07_19425 [Candidatus Latescibacteria bacterium]|nr:hypothetical protein [Candidatus Latescibacterota bacterium]